MAEYTAKEEIVSLAMIPVSILLVIGGLTGSALLIGKAEADRLKEMPDSYWEAQKAEAESEAKVRELEIASEERLKIDQRNRADAAAAAKREFEKTAPPEYWDSVARQTEAHERAMTEREYARRIEEQSKQLRRMADRYKF